MNISNEDRTLAMLAHVLSLLGYVTVVGGWLPPLLIYFMKRDSQFVAFHALQAVYFTLLVVVATLAVAFIGLMTCGLGFVFAPVVPLVHIILGILTAIKANSGELAEYPLAGGWARNSVGL